MSAQPQPLPDFDATLAAHGLRLTRAATRVLQVNLGKRCNLACSHCHVDAGPKRTENMDARTVDRILDLLARSPSIKTLDLTGGAPELNENFRRMVEAASRHGVEVIDRCNLTVLFEPGQEDTAEFLAAHGVRVVASLPCYTRELVERQRGKGVFEPSIHALQRLNALGYGRGRLRLDLVYNPAGPSLPPAQAVLEARYKQELSDAFGVVFDRLLTITNVPISRFLHALLRDGRYEAYQRLLLESFNPAAAAEVMCRDTLSVSWDGRLYDCDFNQMIELPVSGAPSVWDLTDLDAFAGRPISTRSHCFACTAGNGSSCGGSLT